LAYTDQDIDSAVSAGIMSADTARALRDHVATQQRETPANEENFRLVSGFNDIFVAIAAIIMLFAMWWIGNSLQTNFYDYSGPASNEGADRNYGRYKAIGGLFCAGTAWLLAEFFSRKRKMALPSIILLLATVIGLFFGVSFHLFDLDYTQYGQYWQDYDNTVGQTAFQKAQAIRDNGIYASAASAAAIAAFAFWRRFRVPIAVAATTGMAALALLFGIFYAAKINELMGITPLLIAMVAGLAIFGYAMWWDVSDRERKTQRSDVAFWLHMIAAPMIAHALFGLLGVSDGDEVSVGMVATVLGLYGFFALVAVAVDRRALLVSALAYVLIALTALFRTFGMIELSMALTALIIGSALLLLSAFWAPIRKRVLKLLPVKIAERLPVAA
jgi:hypothetical protein